MSHTPLSRGSSTFCSVMACSPGISNDPEVHFPGMGHVLFCRAIADSSGIVSNHLWRAGCDHSAVAAARLADLVWHSCVGEVFYRSEPGTWHAAEPILRNASERHLGQRAILGFADIGNSSRSGFSHSFQ